MSEKRFTFYYERGNEVVIEENGKRLSSKKVVEKLNEQQATIQQLKAKLKEKEEDEQLYANEILELRETNKEWLQFKELGGDY